jgi:putative endonuclease
LQLVERNFRRRVGEIDLIVRRGDELIVIEVRTRSNNAYGGATASVD